MLVLCRKIGQKIIIGEQSGQQIILTICGIEGASRVRIGIDAPPEVPIVRSELVERGGLQDDYSLECLAEFDSVLLRFSVEGCKRCECFYGLRAAIAGSGVPLRETSLGDRFLTGDQATIRVLHPPPQGMGQSENADSILLEIESAGRRILLTGDLASPGLEAVVAQSTPPFDVAMIPHHGSATSNPPRFAAWSRPHWAVISGDLAHDSRVAVDAYQKAGAIVFNTATSGAVHVGIDPTGQIRVDRFRLGDRW